MVSLTPEYSALYDAGQVRLAELGQALLDMEAEVLPTGELERAIIDLYQGLEALFVESDPGRRELIAGYLNEVYGLRSVGLDPFLRASLPTIPSEGTSVVYTVLGLNGAAMVLNSNILVGIGAALA